MAALAAKPETAWMAQVAARDDVAWRAVQEAHDSWDYKSQGLSGPGAAIVAIAVMVATQGMGVEALGALGVEGLSGASAAMVNAGFSSLVAQASVSLINNQGDIGKVLQEMGSTQTLKTLAITVASAGAFHQVGTWTDGHFTEAGNTVGGKTPGQYFASANHLGNVAGHALVGGAASVANGGSFASGALSGGFGATVSPLTILLNQQIPYTGFATTVVVGGAAGAMGGGSFGNGAWTSALGQLYNEMGLSGGVGIIGGKADSFGSFNVNGGFVFSDWDPRSWGIMGQVTLSDTSGAGAYVGVGLNLGGWISGTNTPSGDSGWSQYKEFNANAGLIGSVGGSLGATPDVKNGYGSLSGALGTKVGAGLGIQGSSGMAQSRTWVWRPFARE